MAETRAVSVEKVVSNRIGMVFAVADDVNVDLSWFRQRRRWANGNVRDVQSMAAYTVHEYSRR